MRIIVAKCSATYSGRGDTKLNPHTRAIIIKADGCISIHNETSNKPLNYMGKDGVITEYIDDNGNTTIRVESRKEHLTITLHEIVSDDNYELPIDDEGLHRDGTEAHLQEWLAENIECVGEGWESLGREYPTGSGPVDILAKDPDGNEVAIEVKRVAMLGTVYQILRYVDALNSSEDHKNVTGVIAALDIRPNTMKLAAKRGIRCVTIPSEWNSRSASSEDRTAS